MSPQPILPDKPLSLWGFMGCGKSHWGERLSQYLDVPWMDLDRLVEQRAGMAVSEIFRRHGETAFRELESEVLRQVLATEGHYVLSLGGGTPCFFDNAEQLRERTLSVYLKTEPALLAERLRLERANRPMLSGWPEENWEEKLAELLHQRATFYEKAEWYCPMERDFPTDAEAFLKSLCPFA